MFYGLRSQNIPEDDRREIAHALQTLFNYTQNGTIVLVLEPHEPLFCIYCEAEVIPYSRTARDGRQIMFFQHRETTDPVCVGNDHYIGVENPTGYSLRVDRIWEWLNPPRVR